MTEPSAIPLSALQQWFASLSTDASGVEAGLAGANRGLGLLNAPPLEQVVKAGPCLSAHERLQIYNHSYFARLTECLADDYPALAEALGESAFAALARDYIQHHPSSSPSLNAYGRHLSTLCRGRVDPWAAFAADLARLEWALVEVVHAPAGAALAPDALSAIPPASWATARLVPSPTLRVLSFDYPVGKYFQAFREERAPSIPEPQASATAVYRKELTIWRMELEAPAAHLLLNLVTGVPLNSAILELEQRADDDAARQELGRALPQWLSSWVSSGFFAGIEWS